MNTDDLYTTTQVVLQILGNDVSKLKELKKLLTIEINKQKKGELLKYRALKQSEWRSRNKEKLKNKITCEICDCEIIMSGLVMHQRTQRHQRKLNKSMKIEEEKLVTDENIKV